MVLGFPGTGERAPLALRLDTCIVVSYLVPLTECTTRLLLSGRRI